MAESHEIDWALEHAPPPGGLSRLRARLDAPRRRRWWPAVVVGGVAVAVVAVVALGLRPATSSSPAWASDPLIVALHGEVPRGIRSARGAEQQTAVTPVDVSTAGVVMARVASLGE